MILKELCLRGEARLGRDFIALALFLTEERGAHIDIDPDTGDNIVEEGDLEWLLYSANEDIKETNRFGIGGDVFRALAAGTYYIQIVTDHDYSFSIRGVSIDAVCPSDNATVISSIPYTSSGLHLKNREDGIVLGLHWILKAK